ncbi:MAG: branched-chain amino acid ABC transporter permease [Actinobacteria bacterium]|nr:MAG: branched-chain amino acid ABC transporter permease [Actinomycetota bacterium]
MRRKLGLEALAFLVLVGVVAYVPHVVSDFHSRELAQVGMYFIALIGLNVLTGYSGQISLGHGAFMAIGGYTSAVLIADHGLRDVWTIPIAGVVAGIAGLLVGLPALRISGMYLALVTFGIAVAFPQLPKKYGHFLGGSSGKSTGLYKSEFGIHTTPNHWLYYLTWVIALVLLAAAWALLRGRMGRTLQALRDSEVAAVSSGVNVALYKTSAFGISAFYAGVAGSLFGIASFLVTPDSFPILLSVYLVVGLVAGGLGSLAGAIGGAALVFYLDNHADAVARWANHLPGLSVDPKQQGISSVVFGAVLILVMLVLPTGVGGFLRRVLRPLTSRLYTRS